MTHGFQDSDKVAQLAVAGWCGKMVDGKPELTGGDATVIERQGFAGQYLPAGGLRAGTSWSISTRF